MRLQDSFTDAVSRQPEASEERDSPLEGRDSFWLRGGCHLHALAAVEAHGGGFAAILDNAEPWLEDEDGEVVHPGVWHVWSVHDTAGGQVIRDVTGDFPASELRGRAIALFPDAEEALGFGDISLDPNMTREEVLSLCEEDGPLLDVTEGLMAKARSLPTVRLAPGPASPADEPAP